jgi:hypothetical protein
VVYSDTIAYARIQPVDDKTLINVVKNVIVVAIPTGGEEFVNPYGSRLTVLGGGKPSNWQLLTVALATVFSSNVIVLIVTPDVL